MEIKYQIVLVVGFAAIVFLLILGMLKTKKYKKGKKISSLLGIEESSYYKRKVRIYKFCSLAIVIMYIATLSVSFFLLAEPYTIDREQEEKRNRDIILCLDVSTSVDELNYKLVKELKNTVNELKGERFGVVIFNTSAVMACPLTDDYEYVIEVLDKIETSMKQRSEGEDSFDFTYDMEYILEGTLVGNQINGSSLIGDGLATAACDFPNIEEERSRIIIFSTDNDLAGNPIFTLDEAADICKEKKTIAYGIGTRAMEEENVSTMKSAMEKTGGRFYMEEESGSMKKIVESIDNQAKSLIKGKVIIHEIPWVKVPVIILTITFSALVVLNKILAK